VPVIGGNAIHGGTKDVSVPDTTMNNTTAYTVTIPASWNFKGYSCREVDLQSYAYAVCALPAPTDKTRSKCRR